LTRKDGRLAVLACKRLKLASTAIVRPQKTIKIKKFLVVILFSFSRACLG
jgi:hypothetical protein